MTNSESKHTIGETKEVVRFAFFPMIIESRFVWFKKYKAIQEYSRDFIWDEYQYEYYPDYYWKTIERKLIRI